MSILLQLLQSSVFAPTPIYKITSRRAGQMRFTGPGDEWYRIRFEYGGLMPDGTRNTYAYIEPENPRNRWTGGYGYAFQHTNDRFCKETGRKLALKRAIAKLGWPKEYRRKVWNAYHSRGQA
jgi:hypothetical protein